MATRETENRMLMQNFGMTNKEHYGILWYFLEWSTVLTICLNNRCIHNLCIGLYREADTHAGFCSRSMLQGHAAGTKLLRVYQRFHGYTSSSGAEFPTRKMLHDI